MRTAITDIIPEDITEAFGSAETVYSFQLSSITSAISSFETILKNDMPEMSTYAVAQIGIWRTEALISNSDHQIDESVRQLLLEKARADVIESGRCLAFRLSTASAFHICRAIETCIDQYIEHLTGKPYPVSVNGGNNNWGAKILFLKEKGAAEKVTEYVGHIKKQYRNPVSHPEVVVSQKEAVDLFNAALSAISMMLNEVGTVESKQKLLPLSVAGKAEGDVANG